MRGVANESTAAPAVFSDIDAIKAVCAALALAIATIGFRIVATW